MAKRSNYLHAILGACSAGAGVTHVLAAGQHTQHVQIAGFFVVLAVLQFAWAGYAVTASRRPVLLAGAAGNAAVVGMWLLSRTAGFPIHPGIGVREPVGALDVAATLLEVVIVAGCLFLLAPPRAARPRVYPAELAAASIAVGLMVLAIPPVMGTPMGGPQHDHEHLQALGAIAHVHGGAHLAHLVAAQNHGVGVHAAHATHSPAHSGHLFALGGTAHVHPTTTTAPPANLPAPRGDLAEVRYGPFSLSPAQVDKNKTVTPAASNIIQTKLQTPCSNCYLTAMVPDLVYADGSRANFDTGAMLHHAVLGDAAQTDLTCGRGSTIAWMGRRFYAAGNERTQAVLPSPFGYKVGASDWWTGVFELMNFKPTPQTVWFKFTVRYLPASDTSVKQVLPLWLDENNCGNSQYAIPAGQSTKVWDWTSSVTGRLVFAGGHVHDYGKKITFSNASTKQQACKSVAGYGHDPSYEGNIESMSVCSWDQIGTVRSGETLEIAATYDSPDAQSDVMGIVLAYVYETSDLSGGSPAPASMTNPPDDSGNPNPTHHH